MDFCLTRFPGHLKDNIILQNGVDETIAWGVELVEGRDDAFLWVVGFIVALCSLAFGICWAVFRDDISGGFTVASYAATTLACFVGTVQYGLESVAN
jgi:hypothetical protein